MMYSTIGSVFCHVALPRHTWSAVWRRPVGSPRTVVVSCEWSIGLALHCNCLSARLAGHDGAAYPHVLQTIMALASGGLETREPSCIGRPAMPFFIHEARIHWTRGSARTLIGREVGSGAVRYVAAPKSTSVGRHGPEL
jgi:hypothetical protein